VTAVVTDITTVVSVVSSLTTATNRHCCRRFVCSWLCVRRLDELLSSVSSRVDYCVGSSSLLSSVRVILTAACLTSTSYSRVYSVIVSVLLLLLLVGRQLTVCNF